MAEPALTPALALDYLDELSVDIRAGLVLDGSGAVAAARPGDGSQTERMRDRLQDLLARAERAGDGREVAQVEVSTSRAAVFCVRNEHWTLAVVAGRFALSSLMFYDLRHVLADLGEPA